ncbi:MAG: hypothetical protein CMJ87_13445 [Planctomycetes bacterium]|jgi:hypothetical protein|nr:hypothetical protein [Planctomycetota bacterium]
MIIGLFGLFGGKLSRGQVQRLVMRGTGLVGKDLSGLDLSELHMPGTLFNGAKMVGTNLSGSTLMSCQLNGADLGKALLVGCEVYDATMEGTRLAGADLSEAEIMNSELVGVDLSWARLQGTRIDGCTLRQCNLEGAVLTDAKLDSTTFVDCRFDGANLHEASTRECRFEGCEGVEAMPPKWAGWDMDDDERVPYCRERLETLADLVPGKVFVREDDREVHYSGRVNERPFRIKVCLLSGNMDIESKLVNGQVPFFLRYDPDKDGADEADENWDDTHERELTHFVAPGLFLKDYPHDLDAIRGVLDQLPSTFGERTLETMVKLGVRTLHVGRETISLTFVSDLLAMDLAATMPGAIAFVNETAALVESLGRVRSEGEQLEAQLMAQYHAQMRGALTPDMMTPIEGFDLATYAAIEAERVHLATEDYPDGFHALLARFELDEARFTLVSGGWQARMMNQENIMAAGAIAAEYSRHFAAAAAGPYAPSAHATAQYLGTSEAPEGPEPISFERYVEIATAQEVWLGQGKDAVALARTTFEMSMGDWANIEIYWGQQMAADGSLFDTMSELQERYRAQYG